MFKKGHYKERKKERKKELEKGKEIFFERKKNIREKKRNSV